MAALAHTIALHDPKCGAHTSPRNPCLGKLFCITDVEAFVQATINRSRRVYGLEEREELVGEGLRITYDLASRFDPHREGYEQGGRLCGFVAKYLTLKLEDAYHRLHPEHQLRTDPETGKRSYAYGEKAVSLEALTGDDPDSQPVMGEVFRVDATTVARRTHKALYDRWTARVKLWSEIAGLWAEGATDSDVEEILGITPEQVKEAKTAIAPEMPYILGGEE